MSRLLLFILVILQNLTLPLQANPVRAMWVVRYTLLDNQETDRLVQTAKKLNLTDLYVQVRALGKFFDSTESTFDHYKNSIAYKNFNKILIDAHKQNIRVHAWLNAFYIHSRTDSVLDKNHLAYSEQSYVLRDAFADSVPNIEDMKEAAIEGLYLDPINQKNYNYLINEIEYLIDSLKVDGIHLDYFRYPNQSNSFSPKGRTNFVLNNYVDPVSIYQNDDSLDLAVRSKLNKGYKLFLMRNLSDFMSGIKNTIEAYQKKIILSVAVKPDWEEATNNYLQNWREWLEKDLCDQVVLMNYSNLDSVFYKNLIKAMNMEKADSIVIGVATYNQDPGPIVRRLEWLKKNHSKGFALFSYNDIITKPTLITRLVHTLNH